MDLLADPRFATLSSPAVSPRWEAESHGSVVHAVSVADGMVKITQSGASGIGWQGELRYAPFPVWAGEMVDVSFSACFSVPTRFGVWIGLYRHPWSSLVAEEDRFDGREAGPEWKEYRFRARIAGDAAEARLNFVFGERNGVFSLRDVSLCRD